MARPISAMIWLIGFLAMLASSVDPAFALSAELATKCRAMAIKAHPPVLAGSKRGSAKAELDYYRMCVKKDGKVG